MLGYVNKNNNTFLFQIKPKHCLINVMSFDMLRMSLSQNKALHCYLLLTVWILLLIGGVYKFLEPEPPIAGPHLTTELFHNLPYDKTKKVFRICNFPSDISEGDEGTLRRSSVLLLKLRSCKH